MTADVSHAPSLQARRSRGIVWVCDLADSSSHLNDNKSVAEFEEFLQRFLYISLIMVEAAGGRFIKWTGDGFLAWFETPLHRESGRQAAIVIYAAWHLSMTVNLSQLGVSSKRKFAVRHGITYEHDALVLDIETQSGTHTTDLLGRAVVLAFRLASLDADFPRVVTQKELISIARSATKLHFDFVRRKLSREEGLKYLKGEKWGASSIYVSSQEVKRRSTPGQAAKRLRRVLSKIPKAHRGFDYDYYAAFVKKMCEGPEWCRQALEKHNKFFGGEVVPLLEQILARLEKGGSSPLSSGTTEKHREPANRVVKIIQGNPE